MLTITPDDQLGFRALTVRQPHAGEIAKGRKRIEYRSWGTDYRGDLLITASANADNEPGEPKFRGPLACAICVVTLVDTIWPASGDCEWILENPRVVKNLKTLGKLQLWPVPPQLAAKLGITW